MVQFYIALLYLLVVLGLLALSRCARVVEGARGGRRDHAGGRGGRRGAAPHRRRALPPWQRCCSPLSLLRLRRSQARAAYHDLRAHFVLANGLPRNFPFHTYLTSASEPVLAELTHVHPIAYVVLLLWVELDLLLRASLPADGAYAAADPPLMLLAGAAGAAASPSSCWRAPCTDRQEPSRERRVGPRSHMTRRASWGRRVTPPRRAAAAAGVRAYEPDGHAAPPAVPHGRHVARLGQPRCRREDLHDGARRVALGAGGQEGLFWWGSPTLMLKHTGLSLYAATVVVAALLADASDDAADAHGSGGSRVAAGGSAGDGSSADDGVFDPTKLKLAAAGALFSVGALLLPTIITDYAWRRTWRERLGHDRDDAALARLAALFGAEAAAAGARRAAVVRLLAVGGARLEAALDGEGTAVHDVVQPVGGPATRRRRRRAAAGVVRGATTRRQCTAFRSVGAGLRLRACSPSLRPPPSERQSRTLCRRLASSSSPPSSARQPRSCGRTAPTASRRRPTRPACARRRGVRPLDVRRLRGARPPRPP